MKRYLFTFLTLLIYYDAGAQTNNIYAQDSNRLILSDPYPQAGEKIAISYNVGDDPLEGMDSLCVRIYYGGIKDHLAEIPLTGSGEIWKGEFKIPDSAKIFVINIGNGQKQDNNGSRGYIYLIYKNKQPVRGAYAEEAQALNLYGFWIIPDVKRAIDAYEMERKLYPEGWQQHAVSYCFALLNSRDTGKYKPEILNEVKLLGNINDEEKVRDGIYLLNAIGAKQKSDSLTQVYNKKFPKGKDYADNLMNSFYELRNDTANAKRNLLKIDSVYQLYISAQYKNSSDEQTIDKYLAFAHLKNMDNAQYQYYRGRINNKRDITDMLNYVAYDWGDYKVHLPEAENLSKESIDSIKADIEHPYPTIYLTAREKKEENLKILYYYTDTYAFILYQEGKFAEALKNEIPVWENNRLYLQINEHYVLILMANGDYVKAKDVIETIIGSGQESGLLIKALKECYIKIHNSDEGYDQYLAGLKKTIIKNIENRLSGKLIDKPAPDFTLKDLTGKSVSFSQFKGKIIILDFWSTHCDPQKAYMSAMQMAVDRFKNRPDVVILFVDTWEWHSVAQSIELVKNFLSANNYSFFNTLIDDEDGLGNQGRMAGEYNVNGLTPTTVFIDKSQRIRLVYEGNFHGRPEEFVDMMSAMVNLLK